MEQSRRKFIKTTGAAALGSSFVFNIGLSQKGFAANADTLKVGLVGCGGRGSGAASQALSADSNVVLTAMADIFPDRMQSSLENLKSIHNDKVQVDPEHQFIGFDAYKKLIDSGVDVVLLATPPVFRPDHLEYAIEKGKHVFCEKPMAVDAPGVRKILASAEEAKKKSLSLVSGFCWRYHEPKRETFNRVLDGGIGDVMSVYNTYNTGELWFKDRQPEWNEMQYKLRNWLYYNWLSGDHIMEQAVHSIDMMSWAFGDKLPVKATGTGGRQKRTDEKYGNVYDHFAIVYEYENGGKGFHFSRQQKDTTRSYAVDMIGTKGQCLVDCIKRKHEINAGGEKWRYRGDDYDMYQTEHNELFASIRSGKPINDGEWMSNSTMLALMGRMVAYTGQEVTFEEALNSNEVLSPSNEAIATAFEMGFDWPGNNPAIPGETKFF
ncbi:MAG: oxidoreductase [Thalassobius sp.]|nr:oxidoreductase [Thalassovita sp.]